MSDNLRQRTLHALSWSLAETIALRLVTLVITIVMARLLLPEQFGLIAMLTIFTAVAQSFVDSGFGSALIQKQDVTQVDRCSIFYFNILVAVVAAGLLCLAAPAIAAFYEQPLLTPLTRVLSLSIVINSFGLVQRTLMVKQIDFKTQAKVSLVGTVLSGAIGITLALQGFGVWSLAAQSLSSNLFQTALLWVFNTWRPSLVFSFDSLRSMFAYGSRLLISGLLDTIFQNIYLIVIGKLFSAADLGFYTRAKSLKQIPVSSLSSSVNRVMFPVLSSMGTDNVRRKRTMRKALTMLVMVNFPMMLGLAVTAKSVVPLLLGPNWAPCIVYLQLMCIVGLFYPLHVINLNLLKACGRSDLFLRLEIIKKVLVIVNITLLWHWGIEGLLYGQIALTMVAYVLNSFYTGMLVGYSTRDQISDILPYLSMSGLMALAVWSLESLLVSPAFLFPTQVFLGVLIYMLLCGLTRLSAFTNAWQLLRAQFPKLNLA